MTTSTALPAVRPRGAALGKRGDVPKEGVGPIVLTAICAGASSVPGSVEGSSAGHPPSCDVQEEDEKVPWCESRNPSSAESQRWLRRDRGVHSSESSESSEEVDVAAGPLEGPNPPATTETTEVRGDVISRRGGRGRGSAQPASQILDDGGS